MIDFFRKRFFKKETGFRANQLLIKETIAKSKRMKLKESDMVYIVKSLNSKLTAQQVWKLIETTPENYRYTPNTDKSSNTMIS